MDSHMRTSARRYKSKHQRPCDFCRQRRSACRIDSGPPCALCRAYDRVCTFAEAPPPRRRNPLAPESGSDQGSAGHDNSDASPIGNFPGQSPDDATSATNGATADRFSGSTSLLSHQQPVPFSVARQGEGETVQSTHATQAVNLNFGTNELGLMDSDMLDTDAVLLDALQYSTSLLPQVQMQPGVLGSFSTLIGPTDPMDPHLLRQYRYDANGDVTFKRLTVRSVQDWPEPIQFLVSQKSTSTSSNVGGIENGASTKHEELDHLVTPEVGQRLLVLYSKFVFPQFPVVSLDLYEKSTEMTPDVLAAIYLVSQSFATFDEVLCIQTVYETPPLQKLNDFVWAWLHENRDRPTLRSLQSALLLSLTLPNDILMPDNDERAQLSAMIISLAHSLGLQHDPSNWNVPEEEKALRRRLSCLVKANDVWIAMAIGRPPLLSPDNWLVETVSSEDVCTSTVKGDTLVHFIHFTQLSQILGLMLRDVYSLSASHKLGSNFRVTLKTTQSLMERLADWYRVLPQRDHMSDADAATITVNSSSFLHLGYHAIRTLLFRAIMRPFHNVDYMALPPEDQLEFDVARKQVRIGAKACAKAFTSYVRGLDSGDFQAFWPFWSLSAFALQPQLWQMLFLSSPTTEEAEEAKTALVQSRQLLRFRAKSFEPLRFALLRNDSVWWRGLRETVRLSGVVEQALGDSHSYAANERQTL